MTHYFLDWSTPLFVYLSFLGLRCSWKIILFFSDGRNRSEYFVEFHKRVTRNRGNEKWGWIFAIPIMCKFDSKNSSIKKWFYTLFHNLSNIKWAYITQIPNIIEMSQLKLFNNNYLSEYSENLKEYLYLLFR